MRDRPVRIAVLHDLREEGWPSMDQMGALLSEGLPQVCPSFSTTAVCPPMRRFASRAQPLRRRRMPLLVDRLVNRMVVYPRFVRTRIEGSFDLYHIVDHSYAQLALELPADRTIVTCHDVDAFRSILEPPQERRSAPFRAMTRRILSGLRRAACVVCDSEASRGDLVRYGLVPAERTALVRNGIDPRLLDAPSRAAVERIAALLGPVDDIELLHVGSDIPRKRIDRLIDIASSLTTRHPHLRLVRVGSPFTREHRERARQRGVRVQELPFLDVAELAAVYRRATLLLLTPDREGYGLPLVEAFAAGLPVVASDIPALREVGAGLARYVSADDGEGWTEACAAAIVERDGPRARECAAARVEHARRMTWTTHLRALVPVYQRVLAAAGTE